MEGDRILAGAITIAKHRIVLHPRLRLHERFDLKQVWSPAIICRVQSSAVTIGISCNPELIAGRHVAERRLVPLLWEAQNIFFHLLWMRDKSGGILDCFCH